jgi:Na+/H+ antiporter NhaD/arsenite permease-like protein
MLYYRKEIKLLSERLDARRDMQQGLGPLVKIPYKKSVSILVLAITTIALHHKLESLLGIEKNTLLIVTPLAISGVLMIWRSKRARHYIESEVEWWTLLFFMMLFAVAGSLEHTGVTEGIAVNFKKAFAGNPSLLTPVIIFITAIGSSFVDNIVFVAAFIPVVRSLQEPTLWWALLFGACFGGNITVIGSTANIVALGMMEKRYKSHIMFFEWLKIGLLVGVITCLVAWGGILLIN